MEAERAVIELHFYPRSPCGERRPRHLHLQPLVQFLSTLSLRRATISLQPLCGAPPISIHALLAESDATIMPLENHL